MKRKHLLSSIAIFLAVSILSGCSAKSTPITPARIDTEVYTINRVDGRYYLTPNIPIGTHDHLDYPRYSCVSEMRQGIISGFPASDFLAPLYLSSLLHNSASEEGMIKICDLDNLYECSLPFGYKSYNVYWRGQTYQFSFTNGDTSGIITCHDEETYAEEFNQGYLDFLSNDELTLTEQTEIHERSATEYYLTNRSGAKKKYVCYEISRWNKKIIVQETYYLSGYTEPSSTVPFCINMWGIDESGWAGEPRYFDVYVAGTKNRPSVKWLSQFGLTPYEVE